MDYYSASQLKVILSPGDIWQYLETNLVTTIGMYYCNLVVGMGHRCCQILYNDQENPTHYLVQSDNWFGLEIKTEIFENYLTLL